MIRFAALLVAASVLVLNVPSWADSVPIENRPAVTKKIKKKRIVRNEAVSEIYVVVEKKRRRRLSSRPLTRLPRRLSIYRSIFGCRVTGPMPRNTHVGPGRDEHACLGSSPRP